MNNDNNSKILDLNSLKRLKFKRKRGRPPKFNHGLRVNIGWYNDLGDWVDFTVDPNCPMTKLTSYGSKSIIEQLNDVIVWICMNDPEVAAEYQQILESAFLNIE